MRRRRRLTLRPLEGRDLPSTYVEVEPNNTVAAGNAVPIAVGDILTTAPDDWLTIQGVLGNNADRDYFAFTVAGPAGVFFDLDSRDINLSPTLDAVVHVFDGGTGLTTFGTNDDGYDLDAWAAPVTPVSMASSPDSALYLDLPAGTYLARVTSFNAETSGGYRLRLLADANTTAAPPAYASRPGAPVSLFLDLDGHAATDDWGTYSVAGFDLSGDPAKFTPAERLAATNVWRVVAEDLAPFNVNVTTTEPPSFADGVGYRMVLTSANGSRGAALPGSFAGAGTNTGFVRLPAFGDYLGGVSGKLVAAALEQGNEASRQFGVALGLRNYGGVNAQLGGLMQAPDAGLGRATWSAGKTHSGEPPVVAQDDTAVITSAANGITLMPDDAGDTVATAVPLATTPGGVIADRVADRDVFRFPGQPGNATVKVTTDRYLGNLNAAVRVLDGAGVALGGDDPEGTFDAGLTVYLPAAADYFIEVRSHGGAGELGRYAAGVSFAPTTGPGQVVSSIVNGGVVQRSIVNDVVVRFSRPMTFPNGPAAAFRVTGPGGLVTIDIDLSQSTPSQTIARLRYPDGAGGFKSFPDGAYTLLIPSAEAIDDGGSPLDGNADGQPGGDYSFNFHRLFGDNDGDRDVDATDFAAFRTTFGIATNLAMDFDRDGDVDAIDFAQFRQRFGVSV